MSLRNEDFFNENLREFISSKPEVQKMLMLFRPKEYDTTQTWIYTKK